MEIVFQFFNLIIMKSTIDVTQASVGSAKLKFSTVNLLLVGNNPLELAHCSQLLAGFKKRKFRIETAFNTEECFKMSAKLKPDAIILDDSVGFMNLMEITEKLYKDSRYHHIPVIILKNDNYYHAGISDNAVEFLLKENLEAEGLPEKVLAAINNQKVKENIATAEHSLEKRMSKLFLSLFGSKKASA